MPALLRLLVWCFARIVSLYPPSFRARFAPAMMQAYRDALCDRHRSSGARRAAALGIRGLGDHVLSAVAERRFERRRAGVGGRSRWAPIAALGREARLAWRRLGRQPGMTTLAVVTLGVGLGSATAVFSLVDASLLRPIALPASDRLVVVLGTTKGAPAQISYENVRDLARQTRALSALAGMRAQSVNLTGLDTPDRVRGAFVTHELFAVAGVLPSQGRPLRAEDDQPNAAPVAVINHTVWQRHFGGRPDIIGRPITLNNIGFTIAGVMPATFWFPFDGAEVWMPAQFMPASRARNARTLVGFGRLRDEVTVEQARADLAALTAALERAHPAANAGMGIAVEPLHRWLTADVRDRLVLVLGLVIVLVAAATANVASLHVAETAARRTEIAIRAALGAGRASIARQITVEHLIVAAAGGALGVLLASVLVPAAVAAAPAGIFNLHTATVDGRVLAFAALLSAGAGFGSAVIPALHWTGRIPSRLLAGGGRSIGDRAVHRAHGWLVAGQIAVAAVLLTTGGLLVRSYAAISGIDPGFDGRGVHTLEYRLPANKYDGPAQVRFHDEVVERVGAVPGVRGAAAVRALPFSGNGNITTFTTDRTPPGAEPSSAELNTVTDDYFRLLDIPLLQGRAFDARDTAEAPLVVIVSRSLAEREWPGESPIGRTISPVGLALRAEVIGVVDDVRHRSLMEGNPAACYLRNAQSPGIFMTLVARIDGDADPGAIAPAIRRAVWAVDPDQPVWKERSLDALVRASLQGDRFLSSVLMIFSAAGLLLVAAGLYGVVSQSVARRSREIGLRIALGASRSTVVAGVVRGGLKMTVAGTVVGIVVSLWIERLMRTWLHQASGLDVVPYAATAAALAMLSVVACCAPARRAAATDAWAMLRDSSNSR